MPRSILQRARTSARRSRTSARRRFPTFRGDVDPVFLFGLEVEVLPYYVRDDNTRIYISAPPDKIPYTNAEGHSGMRASRLRLPANIHADYPRFELKNATPRTSLRDAVAEINSSLDLLCRVLQNAFNIKKVHHPTHEIWTGKIQSISYDGPKNSENINKESDQFHVQLSVTVPNNVTAPPMARFGPQLYVMKVLQYLQPFLISMFCRRPTHGKLWYGTTRLDHTFHTYHTTEDNATLDYEMDFDAKRTLVDDKINPHMLEYQNNHSKGESWTEPDFRYNATQCGTTGGTSDIFGFEMRFLGHVYPLTNMCVLEKIIRYIHGTSPALHVPPLSQKTYHVNEMFINTCQGVVDGCDVLPEYVDFVNKLSPGFAACVAFVLEAMVDVASHAPVHVPPMVEQMKDTLAHYLKRPIPNRKRLRDYGPVRIGPT